LRRKTFRFAVITEHAPEVAQHDGTTLQAFGSAHVAQQHWMIAVRIDVGQALADVHHVNLHDVESWSAAREFITRDGEP